MIKTPLLILFAAALGATALAQSGRKVAPTRSAPSAPIQPPTTPEPEPTSGPALSGPLLTLPESVREREIKGLNNTSFHLSDFKGQVVVINLWASWCGPCRREVPEYEKVRKAYAGRNVEFVGLTAEDPRTSSERVSKFLREVSFGFRLGWADRDLARLLMDGKGAVPQTLVLDGDGRIVQHWSGYSTGQSGSRLKQAIEGTLNAH